MYDTAKHVEMIKKQIWERHCWQLQYSIYRLLIGCSILFAFLVSIVARLAADNQVTVLGMYGSILLYSSAGGYALIGIIAFMTAVVITVLYIRYRERKKPKS